MVWGIFEHSNTLLKSFVFLKDKKIWAYKDYKLLNGFPKRLFDPLFPKSPDTMATRNGKHYLLKGSFLFEFDLNNLKIVDDLIMSVQSIFPGLPFNVDASILDHHFSSLNNNSSNSAVQTTQYFFKEKWYFKNPEQK